MIRENFFYYLAVMALVTYLIRMLPLVLVKKKIKNKYILSFLHYIPYAVLTVMTIPAIFYATAFLPALIGFATAVILAYFEKPLVLVAAAASVAVLLADFVLELL